MKKVWIFVEGNTDKALLEAVIQSCFPDADPKPDFWICGGWTKLKDVAPKLDEVTAGGGEPIIVFDADDQPTRRQEELTYQLGELGHSCPIFLFPDNQSPGNVETLLRSIGSLPGFFNCWDEFQTCLQSLNERYKTDHHQMVYAYEQVFLKKEEMKGPRFQGKSTRLWEIHSEAEGLKPLIEFLAPWFS